MSASAKKKKGLSMEEKIVLVEKWMTAHPQPYTMKELMQLVPKQTPVIYQSVEECVLMLVAENRVEQDKVGVSTLFWKFPQTETQKANPARTAARHHNPSTTTAHTQVNGGGGGPLTYAELLRRITQAEASVQADTVTRLCAAVPSTVVRQWWAELREEQEKARRLLSSEQMRVGSTDEDAIQAELSSLQSLAAQRARLLAQCKALAALQTLPEMLRRLATATAVARDAANRWTDNYFLVEAEVMARTGQSARDVRAALHVPHDLDFLSDSEEEEEEDEEKKREQSGSVHQREAAVSLSGQPDNNAHDAPTGDAPSDKLEEVASVEEVVVQPADENPTRIGAAHDVDEEAACTVSADAVPPKSANAAPDAAADVVAISNAEEATVKAAPKKRATRKRAR